MDDIIVWPDGTWCYRYDLPGYSWKSDDYKVLEQESEDWYAFNPDYPLKSIEP